MRPDLAVDYSPHAFGAFEVDIVEAIGEFGEEFDIDEGDAFGGRASRKRRRKNRRAKIRGGLKKGVKKIAKSKIVQAVAKVGLSLVPGGGAVGMGVGAAVRGATALASAAKKSKTAKAGLDLARAARGGDKKARATLQTAAKGGKTTLPSPPRSPKTRRAQTRRAQTRASASTENVSVKMPSGRVYKFARSEL